MRARCKATMRFGEYTFHCQLENDHKGQHQESAIMYGEYPYDLKWDKSMGDE